jgi:hypothetical protein
MAPGWIDPSPATPTFSDGLALLWVEIQALLDFLHIHPPFSSMPVKLSMAEAVFRQFRQFPRLLAV